MKNIKLFIFINIIIINILFSVFAIGNETHNKQKLHLKQNIEITSDTIIIEDIVFIGNYIHKKQTLIDLFYLEPQKEYTKNEFNKILNKSIKNLYRTGYFKNIFVKLEDNILYVNVEERAIIKKIIFEGNKAIKDKELKKIIFIREDEPGEEYKVKRDAEKIEEYYKSKGYPFSKVDYELKEISRDNINVIFKIEEGKKVKVNKIIFIFPDDYKGWKRFKDNWKLKWRMNLGKGDEFSKDKLEEDISAIESYYKEIGFLLVKIDKKLEYLQKKDMVRIYIYITPGPRLKIGKYIIEGQTLFPDTKIIDLLQPKPGKYFNLKKFQFSLQEVKNLFADKGHIQAKIIPQDIINKKNKTVDFEIFIEQGIPYYVEQIIIKGNTKTNIKVIKREVALKEGELFDGKKLRLTQRNLNNTGFFEEVKVYDAPGTVENQRILVIEVKEGRTGTLSFGAGYSSYYGFVGFLQVSKRNFDPTDFWSFTGKGQNLTSKIEIGGKKRNFDIDWSNPWFNDVLSDTTTPSPEKPIYLGWRAFNLLDERIGFDEDRKGGNIRVGFKLNDYDKITLKYSYENINIFDVDTSLAPEEITGNSHEKNSTIGMNFVRDKRDNVFFPTKGFRFENNFEISSSYIGGTTDFYNLMFDLRGYKTFYKNTIAARLNFATLHSFKKGEVIPGYEKFFLGGPDNLRGYSERDIRIYPEREGGQTQVFFNLEYRIPLVEKTLSAVFFVDGGNIYKKSWDVNFTDFLYDVGFGFRINSPFGPIKIDFGYRLNETYKGANDKGQTELQFSFGGDF